MMMDDSDDDDDNLPSGYFPASLNKMSMLTQGGCSESRFNSDTDSSDSPSLRQEKTTLNICNPAKEQPNTLRTT